MPGASTSRVIFSDLSISGKRGIALPPCRISRLRSNYLSECTKALTPVTIARSRPWLVLLQKFHAARNRASYPEHGAFSPEVSYGIS